MLVPRDIRLPESLMRQKFERVSKNGALLTLSRYPIREPPRSPPTDRFQRLFDETEAPLICCGHEQQQPLGYPWHADLASRAASMPACVLCAAVHEGFQVWLNHFERGEKKQFYVEFRHIYNESVPNGERLWLTKRPSGAPGLSVLAKDSRRPENVHVLAVVAFSVTASELLRKKPCLIFFLPCYYCIANLSSLTNRQPSSPCYTATSTRTRLRFSAQSQFCCRVPEKMS